MKLTIELVPSTSWGDNVRSQVSPTVWRKLRQKCIEEAGGVCEICGGVGPKGRLDCHEKWHYDDKHKTQTLKGLFCLCPACHRVKHMGHTLSIGLGNSAMSHLCKVNSITMDEARRYVEAAFELWHSRSRHPWRVDTTFLKDYIG